MSIAQRARFFSDPYVSPRRPESLLSLGIIPSIDGVYSWDTAEEKLDAIFLSHAHLDHYGYLSMVHRDVPVHCGETTERLMAAITETKRASFETDYRGLDYRTFRTGASVKVGSLTDPAGPRGPQHPGGVRARRGDLHGLVRLHGRPQGAR